MSIIWYLLIKYQKFSSEALCGFSLIGMIEMIAEFSFLLILIKS